MAKVTKKYNFKAFFPEIAEEWHPQKNGSLTPDQVGPGSGKRVWWRCKNGHEWRVDVYSRGKGSQCPYCLGMKPSKDYNLRRVNPKLAAQWHPVKNGTLKPNQVTPGSEKIVWWKCAKGHEWKATIFARKTSGCPICARKNRKGKIEIPSLLEGAPELAKEWHPRKNGDLTPADITCGSRKNVWWRCEEGHEWEKSVKRRFQSQECPYCSGLKASENYNFKVLNPELAKQWHPTKNGDLKPEDITPSAEKFVWWLCPNGHEWETLVYSRNKDGRCPFCTGRRKHNLPAVIPTLAKQWHPTKNGDLTPEQIPAGSELQVWWQCKKGHEWQASLVERKNGQNCPFCSHLVSKYYNLQLLNPEVAKEWHPTKNGDLTPDKVTPGSDLIVWWLCKNGHEWQNSIYQQNKGIPCPYCTGRLANRVYNLKVINPDLAKEWHPTKNDELTPEKITPGSDRIVWWQCQYGHEWQQTVYLRNIGIGCPGCRASKRKKRNH